jgi:hypothetical protein
MSSFKTPVMRHPCCCAARWSAVMSEKPTTHFGLTAGYNTLYFKATEAIANKRDFTFTQSMHGPLFGIGFYF